MDPAGARALHDGALGGWMDPAGKRALHDGALLRTILIRGPM